MGEKNKRGENEMAAPRTAITAILNNLHNTKTDILCYIAKCRSFRIFIGVLNVFQIVSETKIF